MAQLPPLPPLGEALKALSASEPAPSEAHPPLAALVAYREGTLPEDEAEALREHLVLCPECAEQLLDLAAFEEAEPPLGEKPLSDGDVAASWEKLKKRLPDGPPAGGVLSFFRHTRYALPLAACLVLSVAFVAVRWTMYTLAVRNPETVNFDINSRGTRGAADELARPVSQALLFKARGVDPEVSHVRVVIQRTLDGAVVWSGEETERQGDTAAMEVLPAKWLKPGVYQVVFYDQKDQPIDMFSLKLR